ncbi:MULTISPECIES: 4-hydroxy-tetrahydrodipicolinate synthase [unclassified Oleiphilus]|nr:MULTISPECIES: 4-hydroxy-tetrahydrodipicolinate synthase [unclassified Oleiphilus]KZY44861.1 4-hydroxy-tetrahydrodipicolinate synthase [Oleiphilus sp. HI0050]KZY76642.1 4-hydroxy-tetrahydrodipicolinate synthase [Oleiphilus sp. HI0068]KZY85230.1 4-hydroxy-tetrahydrodipicolinate synthase [Oleiphilus sp. HI0072]KZY86390.1 4-hydroxy-tetrahydrodipicolinate synthase [Oleiphilus sp. HI0069]KZZ07374.1 4-hydroxy-tetrahydrodipicolinate synthase [Oleiphilus sp. HI0078]KZZ20345.1 4-hydroxy-tetrahydrodi
MIEGSIVALVTPMFEDGSLDWERLDSLLDFHVEKGTNAIVAVGTTGESATLDPAEHCSVIDHIIKRIAGRIPVIAGTGANSTSEAIELTREAKKLGADACLLVAPYYNKPTQEGLYLHHKAIAEAVEIDQILYNVPGRTVVDMQNETVLRLADVPNIVGIKDATGDIARGSELIKSLNGKMPVYSGDDETAYKLILAGAKGNISVTANVLPAEMSQLCRLALDGKAEQAQTLNDQLASVHEAMFVEANPIPVKFALNRMGLIGSGIRLPLTELSKQYHSQVESALTAKKLI